MNRLYLDATRQVLLVALTIIVGAAFAAAVGPVLFNAAESTTHIHFSYEWALRGYILLIGTLWLWGFTALTLANPKPASVVSWLWLAITGAGVAAVCVLDQHHPLSTEYAWIRYTTSGELFIVALLAIPIIRGYAGDRALRPFRTAWIVVAAGAVFLGLDELCQIHEIIGTNIQVALHLPHAFIDWITLGYGVIGLALALWIGPRVLRTYGRDHPSVIRLFAVGAVLFLSAQVLDTTDRFFDPFMNGLASKLSADPHRVFSDVWYFFWQPRLNFNTFEEVLENLAAGLFAAATMLLLVQRGVIRLPAAALRPRPRASAVTWAGLAVVCAALLVWARPTLWTSSPVRDGVEARRVVGPEHGLVGADAGTYDPVWGALVANEGEGGVIAYHDGRVRVFPDPADSTAELDAVTADDASVYASLPGLHEIERFTDATGWTTVVDSTEGLDAPEGLTVVDSTIYAVDETSHRLYTVDLPTRHVSILPLDDPRCRFPEGIAWHPALGELLVTDDKSGYVVAIAPDGAMRTFASRKDGLKNPEDIAVGDDGNVYVSDPPDRQVIEFTPQGKILGRLRFTRMYGDVVGVEVVGSGADRVLYVVTANASHNDAFVPSGLWEIPLGRTSPLP